MPSTANSVVSRSYLGYMIATISPLLRSNVALELPLMCQDMSCNTELEFGVQYECVFACWPRLWSWIYSIHQAGRQPSSRQEGALGGGSFQNSGGQTCALESHGCIQLKSQPWLLCCQYVGLHHVLCHALDASLSNMLHCDGL